MDIINTEQFIKYGQWVIVVISLLGVYLLSSTKPKSRLSGYIVTALGRFSGAIMFIVLDLYAFVIVNIIHTYIGFRFTSLLKCNLSKVGSRLQTIVILLFQPTELAMITELIK